MTPTRARSAGRRPRRALLGRPGTLALLAVLASLQPLDARAAREWARPADAAADMVGINTHIGFKGTVYDRAFDTIVKPRLLELGARHIRDSPGPAGDEVVKNRFVDLARNGVRTLMINWPPDNQGRAYVKALNGSAGVPVVEAVEPPNERDVPWEWYDFGPAWPARLRDYVRAMYPAYKNDPATAAITVLGPAFANSRDSARRFARALPGASALMDAGNLHNYSGLHPEDKRAGGWGLSLAEVLRRYRLAAGDKPLWVTENGYKQSGSLPGHPAVTAAAAAKYLPRLLVRHLQYGVGRLYVYELINEADEDFGLLNDDGTPRAQFVALKNYLRLFADPGPAAEPASLDFELAGDLDNVKHLLLRKRDGRFSLVLWQGVPSSQGDDDASLADLAPPAKSVVLTLSAPVRLARTWQPSMSGQPLASFGGPDGVATVPLAVRDQLLVVELVP